MKAPFLRNCMIVLAVSLAACSTDGRRRAARAGGVDVARFHLGEPVARAQIAIEPYDRADSATARLSRCRGRGRAPADPARLDGGPHRRPVRAGRPDRPHPGQPRGDRRTDLGPDRPRTSAPSPSSGSSAGIVATLLEVGIKRRSDGTVFWEGRAVGEARPGAADAVPPRPPSGSRPLCFGTSQGSRAALSGSDEPLHFQRL